MTSKSREGNTIFDLINTTIQVPLTLLRLRVGLTDHLTDHFFFFVQSGLFA